MTMLSKFEGDWPAISALLDEALNLSPTSRKAWLEGLIGEHAAHRETLRMLLAHQAEVETDDFLDTLPRLFPAEGPADTPLPFDGLLPGSSVGAYRLITEIGRGGMGTVWLAERADGLMNRRVALKLPRIVWGGSLAERMDREREILGTLEHEHIARLYDAGVDAQGRPFLAMEHVDGLPIDAYCRAHALSVRERVALLLQVMAAVGHAHSRLVVHRDLKPSNILVTPDGSVKLLDFGIAKLLEGDSTERTALTELSGRALTLDYASPEQIRGDPLGTPSDVYSMGVVAYEVLAGARPYRLKRGSAAELEEVIAAAEIPLASSIGSAAGAIGVTGSSGPSGTTGASGAGTPDASADRALRRQLRGDLDAILNHALKKSPTDRYPTMEAFAQDLRRWMDGEPVQARPDGLAYRMAKLVRRHRLPVTAGAIATLALIGGASVALWQAHQAGLQTQRAQAEAATARAVQGFLEGVFRANTADQADPAKARDTTARELLDRGADRINAELKDAPAARLRLLTVLASMYQDLGLNEREVDLQRQRLTVAREWHGPTSDEAVLAMTALANALALNTKRDEATALLKEATALLDARQDSTSPTRLQVEIGQASLNRRAEPVLAMAFAERALAIARRGDSKADLLLVLHILGDAALYDRSFERAQAAYAEAVQLCEANPPLGAGELSLLYEFLGHSQRALNRYAEAETSMRKGVEAEVARNANAVRVAETQTHLAIFLNLGGRFRDALTALAPAWRWSGTAPADLPQRRWVRMWQARALANYGQTQAALAVSSDDVAVLDKPHPVDGMDEQVLTDRALALTSLGRLAEAQTLLERQRQATPAGKPPGRLYSLALRRWQVASGQAREALAGLQAQRAARKVPPAPAASEPVTEQAESAWLELNAGHLEVAEAQARQALAAIVSRGNADYQRDNQAIATLVLGQALLRQRKAEAAAPLLRDAVRLHRQLYDPALSLALADAIEALAQTERALRNDAEANRLLEQVRAIRAAQRKPVELP
ncbi:serine/threonine-protein kinase [Mitsuaria sp. 7]|uniref:serine/threonine-protein kinase n=1 Tax=Mitsuaria sp. 7 TaxID=1658665 RepID=UPI000833E695|nr:serine/threonine-protein kinase [Mitsuaria sp. 7]